MKRIEKFHEAVRTRQQAMADALKMLADDVKRRVGKKHVDIRHPARFGIFDRQHPAYSVSSSCCIANTLPRLRRSRDIGDALFQRKPETR